MCTTEGRACIISTAQITNIYVSANAWLDTRTIFVSVFMSCYVSLTTFIEHVHHYDAKNNYDLFGFSQWFTSSIQLCMLTLKLRCESFIAHSIQHTYVHMWMWMYHSSSIYLQSKHVFRQMNWNIFMIKTVLNFRGFV